jgi:hypothetical protein
MKSPRGCRGLGRRLGLLGIPVLDGDQAEAWRHGRNPGETPETPAVAVHVENNSNALGVSVC